MWTAPNRRRYDRSQLRYPSDLTDDEWAHVAPLIPLAKPGGNKRSVDVREVMNGIMYVLSTGCQWRTIPKCLPLASRPQHIENPVQNFAHVHRPLASTVSSRRDHRCHNGPLVIGQIAGITQAAAIRRLIRSAGGLSLAKTCSIGFKSGEYFGRKISLAICCAKSPRVPSMPSARQSVSCSERSRPTNVQIFSETQVMPQPKLIPL